MPALLGDDLLHDVSEAAAEELGLVCPPACSGAFLSPRCNAAVILLAHSPPRMGMDPRGRHLCILASRGSYLQPQRPRSDVVFPKDALWTQEFILIRMAKPKTRGRAATHQSGFGRTEKEKALAAVKPNAETPF